jgi:DNA-binding response OmpR family regulator
VSLLVQRLGRLVSMEEINHLYGEAGGTTTVRAVRMLLTRLRPRFTRVGLVLHTVRGRGVILELPSSSDGPDRLAVGGPGA